MTGAPAIPTADRKGSSALDRRRPNAHRRHSGLVSVRRATGGPLPFRRHERFAGASGPIGDDQLRRRLGYRADRDKPLHRCCARADPILGQIAWQGLCQPLPTPQSMRRPNLPDHARIGRVRFRPGRSPAADAAAGACLIRLVRGSPGRRRKGTVPDMTEPPTAATMCEAFTAMVARYPRPVALVGCIPVRFRRGGTPARAPVIQRSRKRA